MITARIRAGCDSYSTVISMDTGQWHTVSVDSKISLDKDVDHISWLDLLFKFDRVKSRVPDVAGFVCSPMLSFPCLAISPY